MSAQDQARVRVLVLDHSDAYRNALWAVVAATPGFELAGQAASGTDIDLLVALARPQLVLLDVQLRDGDGIQIAEQIRQRHPDVVVVLLSTTPRTSVGNPPIMIEDKLDVSPRWLTELWERRGQDRSA